MIRAALLLALFLTGCRESGPAPEAVAASCSAFEASLKHLHALADAGDVGGFERDVAATDSLFEAYAAVHGDLYSPLGSAYSQVVSLRFSGPRLAQERQRPEDGESGDLLTSLEQDHRADGIALGLHLQTVERSRYCARLADR